MKKNLIAVALLAASGFANAADGTLNFTGSVTDTACTVTPASATQTVALGQVNSKTLATAGASAGATTFSITVSSCPAAAVSAKVKFGGAVNAANPALLALTPGGGVATGVGIGLYESDNTTLITLGSESASKALSSTVPTTLNYIAKYVATGTAVAGTANATSDFTIIYN